MKETSRMAKVNMFETATLLWEHPWVNNPDTKYNADGVFKLTGVADSSLPTSLNLQALIDEKAAEAFERLTEGLSAGEKKKWKLYVPYVLEDDEATGEPTGRIKFGFKRNRKIKLQGGEEKLLSVSVYDSSGKIIAAEELPAIYGGSSGKVLFSFRDVKVPGTKQAGVKLDFAAVKVKSLAKSGQRNPFSNDGEEEGGYVFEPGERPVAAKQEQVPDEGSEF
jgi:hypothetical protein